ncbi:MAG: hypothetical protein RLZZ546_404 [Bacteroidota bacterium]
MPISTQQFYQGEPYHKEDGMYVIKYLHNRRYLHDGKHKILYLNEYSKEFEEQLEDYLREKGIVPTLTKNLGINFVLYFLNEPSDLENEIILNNIYNEATDEDEDIKLILYKTQKDIENIIEYDDSFKFDLDEDSDEDEDEDSDEGPNSFGKKRNSKKILKKKSKKILKKKSKKFNFF